MIETLTPQQWEQYDAEHPAPSFFARPAWANSLAQALPGMTPAPLRVSAPGERSILIPAMQMHGGKLRWREYCAFPLGGYTCFLHEDGTPASAQECERALRELAHVADVVRLVPWPLAEGPQSGLAAEHETAVVDLRDGLETALKGVAGIFRRMAGQAERRGVVCAPSSDADAVDRYYALLEASALRWGIGTPKIPKALIAALVRNGGPDVEIWFARAEERDIGGGIVFYGSQEFFFWSAAMDVQFSQLRPSNALNFALLRAAAQRGMHWYNLGSSEGLPGVAKFKEHLGARGIPYRDVELSGGRYRMYATLKRAIAARPGERAQAR